jgi:hypothetical protein
MSILRNPSRERFTIIDNQIFNSGMSMEAIGLASYLFSKPDGWRINQAHLRSVFNCGRERVTRVMGELQAAGYLEKRYIKDPQGRMFGTEYILHECAGFPTNGSPERSVSSTVGEPVPLVNTDLSVNTETTVKTDSSGDVPSPTPKNRFDDFWKAYPKKRGKKPVSEIWKRKRLDDKADLLIADIANRSRNDRRWLDGFIPDPKTYLNQERWTDEIELQKEQGNGRRDGRQKTFDEIQADLRSTAERLARDGETGEGHRTVEADPLSGSVVASY